MISRRKLPSSADVWETRGRRFKSSRSDQQNQSVRVRFERYASQFFRWEAYGKR